MNADETLGYLAARKYGYTLFQRLLGCEPSAELLKAVDLDVARESFGIVSDGSGEAPGFGDGLLACLQEAADDLPALQSDYRRLFEGPAALPAPPWESVYTSNKRLIMQPSTLEVRAAYRDHGFLPALYPHVPDDHIALELDFLAALGTSAFDACERGDEGRCRELLEASGSFIDDHLGAWVDAFASNMVEKGGSYYYGCIVRTLAAFVAADAAALKGLRGQSMA